MKGLKNCWLVLNGFSKTESTRFSLDKLYESIRRRGVKVEVKNHSLLPVYYNGDGKVVLNDKTPDFCVYWDKDVERAAMLEKCGVRVFNKSEVIEVCDNKCKTFRKLSDESIKMPETLISPLLYPAFDDEKNSFLDLVEKVLNYPVVVKEAFGSFGAQVYLAQNRSELNKLRARLKYMPHLYQRFVADSAGTDLRMIVIGGKTVASMKRTNPSDFRANIELGGKGESYTPTAVQKQLAEKICRLLGADYIGVDFLTDGDETLLCEVNTNAHFKFISECTGVDVAEIYVDHMLKETYGYFG